MGDRVSDRETGHHLIAIGASAGGIGALQDLLGRLPQELDATILIVVHRHPESTGVLDRLLGSATPLQIVIPEDGTECQPSTIYVAPPDQHMMVVRGRIRLTYGPRENRCRPAIDPLFRSVAVEGRSGAVGIILSGMLDDGVSGLQAIKRCGGVALVQSPEEAAAPDMPEAAIRLVDVDAVLTLGEMAQRIISLTTTSPAPSPDIPRDILVEMGIAADARSRIGAFMEMGKLTPLGCPECGGPLWHMENDNVWRYRCHVGHAYTARTLLDEQHDAIEKALWIALRTLEERANILETLAFDEGEGARPLSAATFAERAREVREHSSLIRQVLLHDNRQGVEPHKMD